MVPKFIMPSAMQPLTQISPMAWALDGFHEILLRAGSLGDALPYAIRLLSFALIALLAALLVNALALRSRS